MLKFLQDPNNELAFTLQGPPTPEKTSDWMRILVSVLTYVARTDIIHASMLYAANPGTHQNSTAAVFEPIAPTFELAAIQDQLEALPTTYTAFVLLHPPGEETLPDLDEPESLPAATGSLLLPGIPDLGLDHRATWAGVSADGLIAYMNFTTHAKLNETIDLYLLNSLLFNKV